MRARDAKSIDQTLQARDYLHAVTCPSRLLNTAKYFDTTRQSPSENINRWFCRKFLSFHWFLGQMKSPHNDILLFLRSIPGLLFHLELDLGNALFPSGFMSKISSTFISPCMLHVPSSSSSLNCTSHWQAIWLKVRIIKLLDLKLPLSFSHFPASFSLTN